MLDLGLVTGDTKSEKVAELEREFELSHHRRFPRKHRKPYCSCLLNCCSRHPLSDAEHIRRQHDAYPLVQPPAGDNHDAALVEGMGALRVE